MKYSNYKIHYRLLRAQQSNRQYAVLRKALRLTVEDESEIAPKDISYVHSVYAPLSVRLAEQLVQPGGWQGLSDVLGLLPGPTVSSDSRGTISGMRRKELHFWGGFCFRKGDFQGNCTRPLYVGCEIFF